ncbi:MAG TPA: COX15/CtaA family protein [Mycobacteriales bacterium]|jgi:cytochrome c oxidase assembly protein subunit 15|nr:COX15/CtaA family protein [Mycobacteriales bacterium]
MSWWMRLLAPLWHPTPRTARRVAGAVVVLLGLVVVTGAVVRLTGSGLGCPTWPKCTETDVHSGVTFHGLIEFGNRVLTIGVFLVGILLVALVTWRMRRRDLYLYVGLLAAGYLGEAVVGGLSVLTRLDPLVVGLHFVLAIGLLWVGVVLWRRIGCQDVPPRPVVGVEMRWLGRGLLACSWVVIVLGILVTGTGPHAGSRVDNRLPFDRRDISQLHSDSVLLMVGAVAVTILLLRLTRAPEPVRRRARILMAVMLAQGAVGFIQYFTGLPSWLVGVHVAGATAFWVATLLLTLEMWQRPALVEPAPAPVAEQIPGALQTA